MLKRKRENESLGLAADVVYQNGGLDPLGSLTRCYPRSSDLHLQNSIKDFPTPKEFGALMEKIECGEDGKGGFRLDELVQMNFGSVQLYVTTAVVRDE